jgi:D-2-hydroxyacid dehydrogenase (NADP+)
MIFETEKQNALDAEVAVVTPPFIEKSLMAPFKHLKWIQLLTAGYDNADLKIAKDKNIVVTNAQDVFSIAIAEDIISKILIFNRQVKGQNRHMSEGVWKHIPITHELYGSTVGIIGSGSIGKETAKRLKSFHTHIIGYRQKKEDVEYFDEIKNDEEGLDLLLMKSDYVIIAIPLNDQTYHLIHDDKLHLMKADAVIINVARGEIIDQDALVKHLKLGKFRGVGLDVTTPEPLPKDHVLWTLPNVFITPHNASASPNMSDRLFDVTLDNLRRYDDKKTLKYIINTN